MVLPEAVLDGRACSDDLLYRPASLPRGHWPWVPVASPPMLHPHVPHDVPEASVLFEKGMQLWLPEDALVPSAVRVQEVLLGFRALGEVQWEAL